MATEAHPARRSSLALNHSTVRRNESLQEHLNRASDADSDTWEQNDDSQQPPASCSGHPSNPAGCIEKPLVRRSKMMRETEYDVALSEDVEHHLARCDVASSHGNA